MALSTLNLNNDNCPACDVSSKLNVGLGSMTLDIMRKLVNF